MEISKALAMQIVHAIYEVVKKDTNLISPSGMIIGSTDPDRIGSFHAAGAYALETASPVFVDESHPFQGSKSGINYPIFLDGTPIAVIGITGQPKELKSYGFLITKITEVFLKEQQLNEEMLSESRALQYVITSLIYQNIQNMEQLTLLLKKYGFQPEDEAAVLSIHMTDSCPEQSLRFYFQSIGCRISQYLYPSEWIVFFDRKTFLSFSKEEFSQKFQGRIHAGFGNFSPILEASDSYQNARTALRHAQNQNLTFCDITDLSVEYLLEHIPQNLQELYVSQLLGHLSDKERFVLKTYFSCDMSLKLTADKLFIHKNTLQYQLDRIAEKCKKNPRVFQDAFLLRLVLYFQK
ncbi:hypothetical protein FND36_00065 [Lachnospiraceae bacterium KGMB03038]|nr:hypothetical protein FND36_00065 [Lachnospiraceae bacterium KGMB03038]